MHITWIEKEGGRILNEKEVSEGEEERWGEDGG